VKSFYDGGFYRRRRGLYDRFWDRAIYGPRLGPELVSNGHFTTNTTGWSASGSATLAAVDGTLEVSGASATIARGSQSFATVIGQTYLATCIARVGTAGSVRFSFGSGQSITSSASFVPLSHTFTAVATTTIVAIVVQSGTGTVYADNVSVRRLL
jgi:hypothetical protein